MFPRPGTFITSTPSTGGSTTTPSTPNVGADWVTQAKGLIRGSGLFREMNCIIVDSDIVMDVTHWSKFNMFRGDPEVAYRIFVSLPGGLDRTLWNVSVDSPPDEPMQGLNTTFYNVECQSHPPILFFMPGQVGDEVFRVTVTHADNTTSAFFPAQSNPGIPIPFRGKAEVIYLGKGEFRVTVN